MKRRTGQRQDAKEHGHYLRRAPVGAAEERAAVGAHIAHIGHIAHTAHQVHKMHVAHAAHKYTKYR
eukprot:9759859-Lingulodinium_polyedra.AAC.1